MSFYIYLKEAGIMHETGYVYSIWKVVPLPIWIFYSIHYFGKSPYVLYVDTLPNGELKMSIGHRKLYFLTG